MTTGWTLSNDDRAALLRLFPPLYPRIVADHVTLKGEKGSHPPTPEATRALIVGHADDGKGVEALVVAIDGSSDRPDGSVYHLTWSLADGRRARESNDVLAVGRWRPVDPPITVRLLPGLP